VGQSLGAAWMFRKRINVDQSKRFEEKVILAAKGEGQKN
jgi:hypothetical protein